MRWGVVVLGLFTGFAVVEVLGGCGFSSPSAKSTDACETFASQFNTCMLTFDRDLTLSGTVTYDTTMHELTVDGATMPVVHMMLGTGAGDVDAIFANNVRLASGAQLRATGALPFAIVANASVTLEDGTMIDVGNGGAGAQTTCANPPMPGVGNVDGAGGGGGGGYGADGGKGGDGNNEVPPLTGGAGGNSIAMPAGAVGGCPGAVGGTGIPAGNPGNTGGAGGLGGGALYLVAADRIDLGNMAVLTAGGGGGRGGGSPEGGGGGGGSGGMLLLEAPHVVGLRARVAANGGGGGEGSDIGSSDVGRDGETGSTSTSRALGGAGGAPAGMEGGRGGSLEDPMGEAVTMVLGGAGGGGGGGVGFIHIVSSDVQLGTVSPAAQ